MKKMARIFLHGVIVVALTLLSEVGGVLYILALSSTLVVTRHSRAIRLSVFGLTLACIWGACFLWIVPSLAGIYNKVPLPLFATEDFPVKPACILYPIFFRNYVTPTLRDELHRSALVLKETLGQDVVYMDGCFPLGNAIPLLPHLSHDDGRNLDLAFYYRDVADASPVSPPSPLGYWAYTQPRSDEYQPCQGSFHPLRWDMPWLQPCFSSAVMDESATAALISQLLLTSKIHKVLIEPHLETRLGVDDSRIRFQGCMTARHDDHLHIQTTE